VNAACRTTDRKECPTISTLLEEVAQFIGLKVELTITVSLMTVIVCFFLVRSLVRGLFRGTSRPP
jgi:hypothetical protein